jgi:hypothetical protein
MGKKKTFTKSVNFVTHQKMYRETGLKSSQNAALKKLLKRRLVTIILMTTCIDRLNDCYFRKHRYNH